ncbi:hypothetical protein GCM10019016_083370 [Streptomyces prasinosporus]|uniref:Solute-binding protein family 5 domain-containing protein n=1 Tax=Streptomyces prasinosporus TaxID=68256 RepID=A0ABP6U2M4_9ACTN
MDPAQIYVSDAGQFANLVHRGLTNFQEDEKGNLTVVGDIATDSGKSSDGGKTWTFTLKDGIKDEDGNVITSADVRHTIERMYSKVIFDGPTYVQSWLSGNGLPQGAAGRPLQGQAPAGLRAGDPGRQDGRLPLRPAAPGPPAGPGHGRLRHRAPEAGHEGEVRRRPGGARPLQDRRVQGRQVDEAGQERPVGPEDGLGAPPVRRRLQLHLDDRPAQPRPSV